MPKTVDETISYYHTKESKWGYRLILGGVKHFGYYPQGKPGITMRQSMLNMMDKVGETLDLPAGSKVLDAGCGEGATAERLVEKFELNVEGVDLLDFNILRAKQRINRYSNNLNFREGDYSQLDYPDNYFDAVYTLETLVHSPDYEQTLKEFTRVLKKNGKLVLFEYSMPEEKSMSKREAWVFKTINEGSAMHSYPYFIHDSYPVILTKAGFKKCEVNNITPHIIPMLRRFWIIGILPYQFIKLFHKEKRFINTMSGVELYKHRDKFQYNIITAIKP